jgi:hypothetical protein
MESNVHTVIFPSQSSQQAQDEALDTRQCCKSLKTKFFEQATYRRIDSSSIENIA